MHVRVIGAGREPGAFAVRRGWARARIGL